MHSIYLDTLVSMKCKYRSYNSRKLRFRGGANFSGYIRLGGASRKDPKFDHLPSEASFEMNYENTHPRNICLSKYPGRPKSPINQTLGGGQASR